MIYKINYLELFSVLLSLATSIFTIQQKNIRWKFDILILLINLYIHHNSALYDKWVSTSIILILDLYGWYNWKYGGKDKKALKVTRSNFYELAIISIVGVILSFALYYPLLYVNSSLPLISSFRTIFSLIAIWLASRKKIENWILWININLISIYIYYQKGLYLFSIKYIIYIILCIIGYRYWLKSNKN